MTTMLSRNWWMVVVRGAAAILFGILVILLPSLALTALIALFAAYALVDGIFAIVTAIQHRNQSNWGLTLIEGFLSIAAGVIAFVWPGITALTLLYLLAAWAIFTGVMEIWAAIELRREISDEWLLGLSGVLSIGFGILLILFPGAGALAVLGIIGAYSIIFGIVMVALGFRLKNHAATMANRQIPHPM
jgi:uncharacterized membrane protein HdeD (DUF308 family)